MSAAAFVLPAGYRPVSTRLFPVASNAGTVGIITIDSAGNVIPIAGSNVAIWIDGIVFDLLV